MDYNIDQFTYNGNTYSFVDNTTTIGTGLNKTISSTGPVLNHSNSVNAQTTQAVYPIKIDAQGHISDYGSAVIIPDVSGKIDTAGSGLSKSGTTLNHSNSVTSKSTQAVYPITFDAQGHITGAGNAATILSLGTEASNAAAGNHSHGNITNTGDITATATVANNDVIVIHDYSANKITNSNIAFGTDQTTFLRNDGNWAVPAGGSGGGSITQTNTTTGTAYRILFSNGENDNNEVSTTVRKNSGLIFNPLTTTLQTSGMISSTNNNNDEVLGVGASNYRYHISIGSRYLRVRDSGVEGTAPNTDNISSTLVLSPIALNIVDGLNTSSGNYNLRAALSNNELRFLNNSNSYSVTPTKITSWDTAASKTAGIGEIHVSAGTTDNIASDTNFHELTNFSILPGKWIINITARFPSNSTGRRGVCLSEASNNSGINVVRDTDIRTAVSGATTFCKVTSIYNNNTSGNKKLYINGYQNSGSSQTVSWGYHAIKISN